MKPQEKCVIPSSDDVPGCDVSGREVVVRELLAGEVPMDYLFALVVASIYKD